MIYVAKKNVSKNIMPKDSESIDSWDGSDDDNRDDLPSMFMLLLSNINIKIAVFIYLIGILLLSDVFVKNVLSQFPDAVGTMGIPTTKGTLLQLLFLVILYLIVDLLVQGKFI